MTLDDFAKLAELVPDGLLLVTGVGRIVAANQSALIALNREEQPASLHNFTDDSPEDIAAFLRLCRRSRHEMVGALHFHDRETPVRLFGRLLTHADDPAAAMLLLRIPDEDAAIDRFTVLNQKIEELGREISRRRRLEIEFREQHDLAAFGRDVGLALAEEFEIATTLQRCTELMVEQLDAAFARIWTINTRGDELELQASAGIYTHLDGAHSRIRVGQYKIGMIADAQKPHLTNAVVGDKHVHDQTWAEREGMVAFAGYPLIVDNRTVGVMAMFARHELSQRSLAAMQSVANSIAVGIQRKQIEAELQRNARILKLADQRKDEFLAMLAHELRNPLAPIRSGLELLQIESGESDTLTVMHDQVQHLTRLVDDLLDVSRIMRGRVELRRATISLNEIIDHAVRTVQPAIEAHRHTLTVSKCDEPAWLHADQVRMGQIVTNLLTNAAKYTPDGGQLSLECRSKNGRVTLKVRDNGVGIDAEFLPDVFELFAQAERGLARSEGGLGIGLTLVRRLIELHDGEISVTSNGEGQGTEFIVQLPLIQPPDTGSTGSTKTEFQLRPDCRILVVDDSMGSARILRRLLQAIGAQAIEMAHDGPSAITATESFRPDVIFLDIGLPGLTGFEVAERLRADDGFKFTRIIALTGYGTAEDRRKSREAGFDDHLVKPVGLDELRQVLSTATTG